MPLGNQCRVFTGVAALGGVMNDPTGTTTCFGFLGFLASLFPRNWPFAMVMLLAVASEVSGWVCTIEASATQADHRPMGGNGWFYFMVHCLLRFRRDAVMLPYGHPLDQAVLGRLVAGVVPGRSGALSKAMLNQNNNLSCK
jgi:hypothetical protein